MDNFTFLSEEQIFNNPLNIIRKRGTKAAVTDFAILLGAYVSDYYYTDNSNNDLKDSPLKNIEKTIEAYKDLREHLKSDNLSDYNYSQLAALMEYRLNVLKTQKEKIDATIPLVENILIDLKSEN